MNAKMFLIHNARPHASAQKQHELQLFEWEIFAQLTYSSDQPPSHFHLLMKVTEFWTKTVFGNDEELKEAVIFRFRSLSVEQYFIRFEKLVPYHSNSFG